ncbi:MAG: hypothetical protein N0E48_16040 [Candidatus Thiodiazotropha endolucinida]|nr:hypothetical protein [Candidatus Thiodiazotropha taylori]MCW4344842.1 hypothetical protein [Candidatus Thiodiazotropha endolucinida]
MSIGERPVIDDVNYTIGELRGDLHGLTGTVNENDRKLRVHENRLRIVERVVYGLAGIYLFVQFILPLGLIKFPGS